MGNIYINIGTSPDAMKAAIAAFLALGGKDVVTTSNIERAMKEEPQSISMDQNKMISWSPTKWFVNNYSNWKQVGDLSNLRLEPEFKIVKVRLNNEYVAEIHQTATVVGCSMISNDRILEVADQIKKNRGSNPATRK